MALVLGLLAALLVYKLTETEEEYGVVYIKNFFSDEDYDAIQRECRILDTIIADEKGSTAVGRKGCFVPDDTLISQLCRSKRKCYKLGLPDTIIPGDIPIQYRTYPIGSSMDWHKDTQLYTKPQYEIVYTVNNSSDAKFQWYDYRLKQIREIQTEPNSAVIVKAEDVNHRVIGSTKGERAILKFVFTHTLSKSSEYYTTDQYF